MKIDILSIFPEYFQALNLSLIGKAAEQGLVQFQVKQLRDYTQDRHRSVDDTPYGGGAGMVMLPEPWALALADIPQAEETGPPPVLIVPSPAGQQFTQEMAKQFAAEERLVFACGRYEGIDERVLEWACSKDQGKQRFRVYPVSLGDYVLNGGEVAVLAMVEAITRLIPGMVGNPESLLEESHEGGLLEYPSYTKPAQWRGIDVPEVLLSGNHAAIAQWRRREQLRRTAERRPELLQQVPEPLSTEDQAYLEQLRTGNVENSYGTTDEP